MVLNYDILEHYAETSNAEDFMKKYPLDKVKKCYFNAYADEEEYKKYLSDEEETDNHSNFFMFLINSTAISDEEIIEMILEAEEEEYYIQFRDERHGDGYWVIYKINDGNTKLQKIIKDKILTGENNGE